MNYKMHYFFELYEKLPFKPFIAYKHNVMLENHIEILGKNMQH